MSDPWKRKEVIGDATLYLGDCLEILPHLPKVDAVITDPPFGIEFKYESHEDDREAYPEFMRAVIAATDPLVGDGVRVFWQGMPNADRWHEWFPKGFRIFAACKGFTQFRPVPIQWSWDPVIFWGKPKNKKPQAGLRDWHVQMMTGFGAGRERIEHPCPRSVEQVQNVLGRFTEPGELSIDPFMGSGTTGVACMNLGRKFIGIEIEPKYFEIACERIENAQRQQRIFA